MESRLADQKKHYDFEARKAAIGKKECEVGYHGLWPALQTPYKYGQEYLLKRGLSRKYVLDYGCGTGELSMPFAKAGALLVGVDISSESIKLAKKIAQKEKLEKCLYIVGDCENLPFSEKAFNYIYDSGSLSCLILDRAYAEMQRTLKKEGQALVVDTLGNNPLLNWNRRKKLKKGIKTKWHVDHVLKQKDYRHAEKYFGEVSIQYFDLFTLCLAPLKYKFRGLSLWGRAIIASIDKVVLSIPPINKMAFKVVSVFAKPIN